MLKQMLAGAALVGATLLVGAPKADAGAHFSIGIGLPGFTYYEPYYSPPVVYREPVYPEVQYYAPARSYYGGGYGYGSGYGYDRGYRRGDDGWHHRRARFRRHCDR